VSSREDLLAGKNLNKCRRLRNKRSKTPDKQQKSSTPNATVPGERNREVEKKVTMEDFSRNPKREMKPAILYNCYSNKAKKKLNRAFSL